MSYGSKQSQPDSEQSQKATSTATTPRFSDQRVSTATQLKQQNIMRAAHSPNIIQKMIGEEEPIQGEFESEAPMQLQAAAAENPNNTGLPDNLKSGIENLSGYSMDDVKVHFNSDKPAQLNAHAYAQGTDIHVAPGQEQHLPHEAWHVVQQKQGRVQPTLQMKAGVPGNDDAGLEGEADVMGAKAIQAASQKSDTFVTYDNLKLAPGFSPIAQRVSTTQWPVQIGYQYRHNGANQAINFGGQMRAFLDANNALQGTTPGGGPQAHARSDAQATNGGDMVLGHLLNDNLGGPGMAPNLYPISDVANREHLATVEFKVKNAVMRNVGVALQGNNNEHVQYEVTVTPLGNAGSGNPAIGPVTNPNATLFSRWRERNNGGAWGNWQQKTINSNASDSMDAVAGGWGKHGSGQRLAADPTHLRVFPVPVPAIPGLGAPLDRNGNAMPVAPGWATQVLIEGRVTVGPGATPGIFVGYIQ